MIDTLKPYLPIEGSGQVLEFELGRRRVKVVSSERISDSLAPIIGNLNPHAVYQSDMICRCRPISQTFIFCVETLMTFPLRLALVLK